MSKERMDQEEILFYSIKKDTEYNKEILNLAILENDAKRLKSMLLGLEIGDKKLLIKELRAFINNDNTLRDDKKSEYIRELKENEDLYKEIEEVILEKLGIEKIEYDIRGFSGIRDTVSDFKESSTEIMLRANLKSISNTQKIIQKEALTIEITENNAEKVLGIYNRVIDTSVNWLTYLKNQSNKGSFDIYDDEYWDLMDKTIKESKKTITIVEAKRMEIAKKYPNIAKSVDEEDSKRIEINDNEER